MAIPASGISEKRLKQPGITNPHVHYQLSPEELTKQTIHRGQGILSNTGALCVDTGEFTGRSPLDKFIVKDALTQNAIDWNNFNIPIEEKYFHRLKKKMLHYLNGRDDIWIRDCYACADPVYSMQLRVITENPWSNFFAYNMFLRPVEEDLENFEPDWYIIQAPGFKADPAADGTRRQNFTIISFVHKTILIGGTGYTGEIKKGVFTVLNFILPHDKKVLSMHCSANMGAEGDVAIFFGLSGTGKTTLSADPGRKLIGDDEHGWTNNSIFNFEGGCYAKCINLNEEKEPYIFHAIRRGALVENITFFEGTNRVDFSSKAITENTRVSYPLHCISNAIEPAIGAVPKNIFFLTCDAYGVLPPLCRLTPRQAMYQFINGYTAKVAGTETGIIQPKATFSTCFGAPFLPLHPVVYAEMLGEKMREYHVNVWMINTGWTGGPYGTGSRIPLAYSRAMIHAALNGDLDNVNYERHPVFGLMMPVICPGVPDELLNPVNTWTSETDYDKQARALAKLFAQNFEKYAGCVSAEIFTAAFLVD